MLSCSVVALLSSLLGLVGLAGLGHHYYHHSPHGSFQWDEVKDWSHDHRHGHSMEAMKQKCDEGFKIIKCHRMCGDDMACHDSCPLPSCPKMAAKVKGIVQCNQQCGSDGRCREVCNRPVKMFIDRCSRFPQRDVPHGFHERVEHFKPPPAQFIVSKFRVCHAKCGDDVLCKEQCPKPFWMKFKTTCNEAIPIMECHQTCGHDHECHQKCPLPSCPHMKAQVEETMKCHGQCGADRECHHMCPKPMKKILMKCKAFTECQGCHKKCHDFSCHRECPKARLWKFFGKHGFGYHDDFHHHHDGNFHHHHDGNFHHHHDGNFHHHHDDDFHHQHDGNFHHHHDGNFHHHHDGNFHHHHDGNFHHHHDGNFHHHHDGNFHHHHDNDGDFHRAPVAPTLPIAPRAPLIATVAGPAVIDPMMAQPMMEPFTTVAPAVPALPEPTPSTKKTITCSMKCGWDAGCWDKCQGDWRELRKHCEEMTEIMVCHKKCFHDHMCHQNCPRPEMPWLKEKVEASLGCHHECGDDRKCHHKCKCPFDEMKEKCGMLGPQVGSWNYWEKEPEAAAIMV
eukprot:symbB.v1.2.005729.t2/scaffold337.1/size226155/5